MIENLKLGLIFYILFNLCMLAKGMDEATWLLSEPCKAPTAVTKFFPGYSLGCKLGAEDDQTNH